MAPPGPGDRAVIGAAVGLRENQVAPFLSSLRSCGYDGDVVLVVDRRLARRLRRGASEADVRLVAVRSMMPVNFHRMRTSRIRRLAWAPVQISTWTIVKAIRRLPLPEQVRQAIQVTTAGLVCTPMELRFLRYRRLLKARPYDRVLLSDVRDVIFQSDPFAALPDRGLAVGIETRSYTIASEPHNQHWIRQAYGPEMLTRIGQNPVSCVGVTYGDGASLSAYLDLMTAEILRLPAAAARRGGADTAIHNVLVWTGRLENLHLLETLASTLATLNGVSEEEVSVNARGRLANNDGSEPSILHQYDRLPGMAELLLRALTV
jgi:hypothetical protein